MESGLEEDEDGYAPLMFMDTGMGIAKEKSKGAIL